MIPHSYKNASDNRAQYEADRLLRQEVTVEWYLENMCDACIFRWTSDEDAEMGLDPWRFYMDLPIDPEDVKARGWRLFVQRRDMPASGPVGAAPKTPDPPAVREMTDEEEDEAAYWSYVSKTAP